MEFKYFLLGFIIGYLVHYFNPHNDNRSRNNSKNSTRHNKSITIILIGIALADLYSMIKYHPEQSTLNAKINHYKVLQNKVVNL